MLDIFGSTYSWLPYILVPDLWVGWCVWTFSKEVKLARYLPFYYVYFIAISSNMFIMDYQGYLHFCSCDLGFDFGFEFDQA